MSKYNLPVYLSTLDWGDNEMGILWPFSSVFTVRWIISNPRSKFNYLMIFNCFCVTPFYCAHRTSLQQQEGKKQKQLHASISSMLSRYRYTCCGATWVINPGDSGSIFGLFASFFEKEKNILQIIVIFFILCVCLTTLHMLIISLDKVPVDHQTAEGTARIGTVDKAYLFFVLIVTYR